MWKEYAATWTSSSSFGEGVSTFTACDKIAQLQQLTHCLYQIQLFYSGCHLIRAPQDQGSVPGLSSTHCIEISNYKISLYIIQHKIFVCSKKLLSFEIFLIIYCMACVVINTAYEGTLKSHLAVVKEPKPLQTLMDMVAKTSGDIVFLDVNEGEEVKRLYRLSPIKVLNDLPEKRTMYPRRGTYTEVYWEPYNGNIVMTSEFLGRYEIMKQLSYEDGSTDMHIIPHRLASYHFVFHITRMNRFGQLFDHRLFQLVESGHIDELLKRVLDQEERVYLKKDNEDEPSNEFGLLLKPINLGVYRLLYIVYSVGVASAFLSCLVERYNHHAKSTNNNFNTQPDIDGNINMYGEYSINGTRTNILKSGDIINRRTLNIT